MAQPEDRRALGKRLVKAMELPRTIESSMAASQEAVGASLVDSLLRSNPLVDRLKPEQQARLVEAMTGVMKRLQERMDAELRKTLNIGDEVASLLAPVYADYFSAAEIRQLIEFYETPLGRKVARASVATQPDVMKKMQSDLMPRMMAVMERVVRDEQSNVVAEMAKIVDELMKAKP